MIESCWVALDDYRVIKQHDNLNWLFSVKFPANSICTCHTHAPWWRCNGGSGRAAVRLLAAGDPALWGSSRDTVDGSRALAPSGRVGCCGGTSPETFFSPERKTPCWAGIAIDPRKLNSLQVDKNNNHPSHHCDGLMPENCQASTESAKEHETAATFNHVQLRHRQYSPQCHSFTYANTFTCFLYGSHKNNYIFERRPRTVYVIEQFSSA